MLRAYKYRIYPTKEQEELLAKNFGCCRYIYNYYLDKKIKAYNESKKTISYVECANNLKEMKAYLPWLKEVDSISLQQSLKDLDKAYQNFFAGAGFPGFKSKHNHFHSYRTQMINNNIQLEGTRIKLPKLGWIDLVKNHNLAKSILDCSWSEFFRMLQYKADWYGRTVAQINTFYPSSQLCSVCG